MVPFVNQLKKVATIYLTHHWVMAGIAAWLLLVTAPQLFLGADSKKSAQDMAQQASTVLGMPIFFLSLMLVPQAKAQFAHARSRLTPDFAWPHVAILAALLLVLVIGFPLVAAGCFRVDPIGTIALAVAMSASAIWASHFNRMLGMVIALIVFCSTMTSAGTDWWLLRAESHPPALVVIVLAGVGLLVFWLWRLANLREEMDDYLTLTQWRTARKAGSEVPEQRRILAEAARRNKLAAWVTDAWHARLGGYHHGGLFHLARLLRYGFGQPAEIQAVFMAVMFAAISLFMARFSSSAKGPGFGAIYFYVIMATIFPGFLAGEWLAQRRPRIAAELLLPLSRPQLFTGLFTATAWNAVECWLAMNAGLVLVASQTLGDQFTVEKIGMALLMTASGAFATGGLSLRISVWPSFIKRLAVLMAAMISLQIAMRAWTSKSNALADAPFVLLAVLLVAAGALFLKLARSAWLNLELG